jgi:uncharacterized protein YbbC (DUF1343 family)
MREPQGRTDESAKFSSRHPEESFMHRRDWLKLSALLALGTPLVRANDDRAEGSGLRCGIDVLALNNFDLLRGSNVGLITNHTGVDRNGQRTIDHLASAPNVKLIRLFSPEHGATGELDQAKIGDTRDAPTGLPTASLYGETRKPTAEMLQGLDTLVFDIQDIGVRFYTYLSTMKEAMLVAAERGLRLVVLDRPNPIGGELVEGPMIDADKLSFVGCHSLPVRHGMTLGELAKLIQAESAPKLKLEVVPVEGWRRAEHWDATGLVWINPSPNMRRLTAAQLYPGVGMLETTNVSVGRGTDTPFELFGAPWVKPADLAATLNANLSPGVVFYPRYFTPTSSVFANERCGGVSIEITDRPALRPVALGLTLAHSLRKLYPNNWEPKRYIRLMGNAELQSALESGAPVKELSELANVGVQEFRARRQQHLLYT